MDGVTEKGGSINSEFWILNQQLAAGCWEPVATVPGAAVLWGLCDPALLLPRSGCWGDSQPHTLTLTHEGSIWMPGSGEWDSERQEGTSLVVQWLRTYIPNAGDEGSISDQGTKMSHATGQLSPQAPVAPTPASLPGESHLGSHRVGRDWSDLAAAAAAAAES